MGGEAIKENKMKAKTIEELRDKFFEECVSENTGGYKVINYAPHDLFEWIKENIVQPEPRKVSVFEDLFDNNNPIEITSDKKMEVCMNCAETFDINYSGCICTSCFLGGENGTLDAEVFMNGCNIIPDASNEDGHDAWTKESVLMLMQLFYKAQSKHSQPVESEPKQVTKGDKPI